jgi:hypothetical protein
MDDDPLVVVTIILVMNMRLMLPNYPQKGKEITALTKFLKHYM